MRLILAAPLLVLSATGCGRLDTVASQGPDPAAQAPGAATRVLDPTQPVVVAAWPAAAAADVAVNGTVSVVFSKEMDPDSVVSAFSVSGRHGTLPLARRVRVHRDTLVFVPDVDLEPSALYTVTVSTQAVDLAGNALAAPARWSFRTAAHEAAAQGGPPTIVERTPVPGAAVAPAAAVRISAVFDRALDCAGLPASAIALFRSGVPVSGAISCDEWTLSFTPSVELSGGSAQVVVSPLVRDLAGEAVGLPDVWTFDLLGSPAVGAPRHVLGP